MIPAHQQFIDAIHTKRKVCVRFYSNADNGVLDRVCAPMDYGPAGEVEDGLNRYWLWDYKNDTSHTLNLLPQQIVEFQMLGDVFDPAQLNVRPPRWSIPRDWGMAPQATVAPEPPIEKGTPQSIEANPS